MRVAVVGAGIMGCATARALAGSGHEVTLYERFGFGHDHGSSHGRTRIVRLAYPDAAWVRLADEALAGWRELEAESGARLLELHGIVEFARTPEAGSRAALTAAGAAFEEPTAAEVADRWALRAPAGWAALYQPLAGIIRADLALRALLDGALDRGARLVEHTEIHSVDDMPADVVVLTVGSWIRRFVPDLPLRVTRETVTYFRRPGPPTPSIVQLGASGSSDSPDEPTVYSLWDPVHGLKVGLHHAGAECDPEAPDRPPDPALVDRAAAWVAAVHPDADPNPVATQTCRYTTTPDESFILRRDGRVVIGSACSGHGFKFAPAIGHQLATLATTRQPLA